MTGNLSARKVDDEAEEATSRATYNKVIWGVLEDVWLDDAGLGMERDVQMGAAITRRGAIRVSNGDAGVWEWCEVELCCQSV